MSFKSVVTGDFNAHLTRWWKSDITNSAGLGLDSLTSSAIYIQIIAKSPLAVSSSMSCIDLIFCTNLNVISKHSVDVWAFDKCHHDIIYGKINNGVNLPPIFVKSGITGEQMLKIVKKQYLTLTGISLFKISL